MKAGFAPGVSEPNAVFGLTDSQMEAIIDQLTRSKHDDLFIITEFNPAIEKHTTGKFIVKILKWLLQGWLT